MVLRAMKHTKSNMAAARFLGCSYPHYKQYAKLYKNEEGKTLFDYFPKYLKVNPELNRINTFSLFYGFNIQRYKPNQCYWSPHCENDGNNLDRLLAWTIYLNTVTDGGGTHYTQYNKTIDAVEGRLVIWPAYWTHFHHGVVSESQTKYIATGWYTFIKPLGQGQLKNWVML